MFSVEWERWRFLQRQRFSMTWNKYQTPLQKANSSWWRCLIWWEHSKSSKQSFSFCLLLLSVVFLPCDPVYHWNRSCLWLLSKCLQKLGCWCSIWLENKSLSFHWKRGFIFVRPAKSSATMAFLVERIKKKLLTFQSLILMMGVCFLPFPCSFCLKKPK